MKYSSLRSVLVPTLMCSALCGCVVGPDFKTPPPANAASFTRSPLDVKPELFSRELAVTEKWWSAYHSSEIDSLVERALSNNPNIEVASANLKAAQENVTAQRGLFFPSVQAGYNASRQNTGTVLSPPLASGDTLYNLHTAQLSVGFVPDIFGGNQRLVESLGAQADSQKYQLAALRITIASNVVAAALQHAGLQEQVRIVEETVEVGRRQLAHMRGLKASGYSSGMDLATQEASYAQARALLPPLQKQLEQTRNLIAILCGDLPNERLANVSLTSVTTPAQLPTILPSQLVARRPDVQAAIEQARSANALVGVATANMLPQFSLTASLSFSKNILAGLLSNDNKAWGISGGFVEQLFAGGALRARKRGAEASAQAALAQYRSTVLTAFQNVADTLYAIESDGRGLSASTDAEIANERLLAMTQKQFDLGYTSGLNLLVVKQAYLQTRLVKVVAYGTYLGDTVTLYQALGGGWTKPNE